MYKHASMVVPLAVPERRPATVRLDGASRWHTSALLAAAVESATLPSRLRDAARRETLAGMAEVLNAMGRQSVAGLQMSFGAGGASAPRRPRQLSEEELAEGVQLDIRLEPEPDQQLEPRARSSNGYFKPRVFSQLVSSRGYGEGDSAEDGGMELDEAGRRLRRSAYEPVTKR